MEEFKEGAEDEEEKDDETEEWAEDEEEKDDETEEGAEEEEEKDDETEEFDADKEFHLQAAATAEAKFLQQGWVTFQPTVFKRFSRHLDKVSAEPKIESQCWRDKEQGVQEFCC